MRFKTVLLFTMLVILLSAMLGAQSLDQVLGAPGTTLDVPGDYATIQAAIDAANSGDTVFVHEGTYYETLTVDKWLNLIGENKETTIIDANGTWCGIYVTAYGVHVSGFTIQNGIHFHGIYLRETYSCVIEDNIFKHNFFGVYLFHSTWNTITNNLMTENQYGVRLYSSNWNTIADNNITSNLFYCISLYGDSCENNIYGNIILNNLYPGSYGIHIGNNDPGNTIYHNALINNTVQVWTLNQTNDWDNGAEGNYWSDYGGIDADGDGIGDSTYVIDEDNQDNYPLMSPYCYWSNPIPGDVNKDMKVDGEDLLLLYAAYGSRLGDLNWNPNADFDGNRMVDSVDLIFGLAPNYGRSG
jgi:parallel beta-helix repeat protein